MTLRQYLAAMTLGTFLCWAAWFLVLKTTDPAAGTFLVFLFFYATLFLALVGTFAVVGFAVRVWILKQDEVIFRNVRKTFRQGVLFASFLCGGLFLQSQDFFRWWILLLLLLLLLFIEFFFISYIHVPKVQKNL